MSDKPRYTAKSLVFGALALLVVVVVGGWWSRAWANSPSESNGCNADTRTWVAHADADLPTRIYPVQCFPAHVRLRIELDGADALDIDVAYPAGQAFRHIGQLGVSPILEVTDFQAVSAPKREAFEALCGWLAAHESELTKPRLPALPILRKVDPLRRWSGWGSFWPRGVLPVLGLLTLGLVVSSASKAWRDARQKRDVWAACGLFVVALVLRMGFGPFGPHHANGQGPIWILAAISDPTRLHGYGPGYCELFSFLCALFPHHADTAIFVGNVFLGAFAPSLLFGLARKLGLDHARAMLAAAVVVIDGVALRYCATEAYFPSIVTLTLGAAWLFVASVDRLRKKEQFRAVLLAMGATLWAIQAARIHPIAWGPAALAPVFVLAMPAVEPHVLRSWKQRGWLLAASVMLAVFLACMALGTSGAVFADVLSGVGDHWSARTGLQMMLHGAFDNLFLLLASLGMVFVVARPRGPIVPAFVALAALMATREAYAQHALWLASYDRLWIAAPLILAACLIPAAALRIRRAWAFVGGLFVVAFAAQWSVIDERTTEQLEYGFFREMFATLPGDCRVVHVPRVGQRIVALPEYAIERPADAPRAVVGVSSSDEVRSLLEAGDCLRLARTSLCTSAEGRVVCDAVESGLHLVPIAERNLPAHPSHVVSTYDRDTVRVVLFDVRP